MRFLLPFACVAAMSLSACQQDRTPHGTTLTSNRAPSATPQPERSRAASADTAVMDYTCEDGHSVVIVGGGDIARIKLSDGRRIDLPRRSGRAPPLYVGEALEFAVTSDGGMLAQDGGGGSPCKAAI